MSHYSDPTQALLARIAKALERIAEAMEASAKENGKKD